MSSKIVEQTIKEQEKLLTIISELEDALRRLRRDIAWGDSSWAQDGEFLDFVRMQRISLISARDAAL
jgi:hypothetical protein